MVVWTGGAGSEAGELEESAGAEIGGRVSEGAKLGRLIENWESELKKMGI